MIVQDNPPESLYEQIRGEVLAIRPADAPTVDRYSKSFAVTETNDKGDLLGGVYVFLHPGWAYIDLTWVDKTRRGNGLGRDLMKKAEEEAVRRGSHSVWLWSQDYEAPGFYEKLGYQQFVVMEDFIPGHQRIGFMKRLAT
jgi:GNAT superfamily N-acetyltransferase